MTLPTLRVGDFFLHLDGTRRKMRFEQVSSPSLSFFRENSPTDRLAWSTDGRSADGNSPHLVMRDPNQYAKYGPIIDTVDTPTRLVVTLMLQCEIDRTTNVIKESLVSGPGMDTEALIRYAYQINGVMTPSAADVAWWVNEVSTGRWRNFTDCLLGFNAAFAAAREKSGG